VHSILRQTELNPAAGVRFTTEDLELGGELVLNPVEPRDDRRKLVLSEKF
jgi:hypothetical protein